MKTFNIAEHCRGDKNVYAVFAHWDYKEDCVKKHEGINWIFHRWVEEYRKQNNNIGNTIYKIKTWKICILSFESRQYFESERKTKMLLDLKTIDYLQIPPGQLNDIKKAIRKLSELSVEDDDNNDDKQLGEFVNEMNFYDELDNLLHKFTREEYNLLDDFKKKIQEIPLLVGKDVRDAINNFEKTLEVPGSDSFKNTCENLYGIIKRKEGFYFV